MVLGSLFYPKNINGLLDLNDEDLDKNKIKEYKMIHTFLYEFTQNRLLYLVELPQFAMLYCEYYKEGVT
jgi:hypothetical protein